MSTHDGNSNFFNRFKFLVKNNCHMAYVFKVFVSLSIFIYLSCIVTGNIDKNKRRLEPTELGLAAILLLINSDLTERLQELKVSKDSVNLTLKDKVHSNLKINQKESHALTYLGEILLNEDKYKEHQKHFFDILLNDGDLELLEDLYKQEKYFIDKSNQGVVDKLLHLISLGFLEKKPEYKSQDYVIDLMPVQADIKEYFDLTDEGKKCLKLGSSPTIQPSATDYYSVNREKMSLGATQN